MTLKATPATAIAAAVNENFEWWMPTYDTEATSKDWLVLNRDQADDLYMLNRHEAVVKVAKSTLDVATILATESAPTMDHVTIEVVESCLARAESLTHLHDVKTASIAVVNRELRQLGLSDDIISDVSSIPDDNIDWMQCPHDWYIKEVEKLESQARFVIIGVLYEFVLEIVYNKTQDAA